MGNRMGQWSAGSLACKIPASLLLVTLGAIAPTLPARSQPTAAPPPLTASAPTAADATRFLEEGKQLFRSGQLSQAQTVLERSLATWQAVAKLSPQADAKASELGDTLLYLGRTLSDLGQYEAAAQRLDVAHRHYQQAKNSAGIADALTYRGEVFLNVGDYRSAIAALQEALALQRQVKNPAGEAEALYHIGEVYNRLSQYPQALEQLQQSLALRRQVGDTWGEGRTLQNLGIVERRLGNYDRALELYQQALELNRAAGDRLGEGRTLTGIALTYDQQGDYDRALQTFKQGLAIRREIRDRSGEAGSLIGIGGVYSNLGRYSQALTVYQQALNLVKATGDKPREASLLNNLAGVHYNQANYAHALDLYQKATTAFRELGNRAGEARALNNLGLLHSQLRQFSQALDAYQQSLTIRQTIGDKPGESSTLHNLGLAYGQLGQTEQAQQHLQQALAIRQSLGDRAGEATSRNGLGQLAEQQGQYEEALVHYQQSLARFQQLGNRPGASQTLNSLGALYARLDRPQKARETIQSALLLARQLGDRNSERIALGNLGYLLEQENPVLAIAFYKQAVNVTEAIRNRLSPLSRQQQQAYAETVADRYRRLAKLLLERDRILEAQQVLDLLKLQELDDYLKTVRGNDRSAQGIDTLPQEQQILDNYQALQANAIQQGKELDKLRDISPDQRTEAQTQRIAELEMAQQALRKNFNDFIRSPDIVALTQELNRTANSQNLELPNLNRLQRQLRRADRPTALLYPLLLDDRIELVLVTAYAPPIRRSVPVNRADLNQAILTFRTALTDRASALAQVQQASQPLYQWLIQPIANDLKQAEIETLLYAPDGALRYLPVSALHNGKRWLVEDLRINNITAATLTDLNPQPLVDMRVLAAAFTQGTYEFEVGTRQFAFAGLLFAKPEVANIAARIPTTQTFLDQDFSYNKILPQLNDHNIIHFATHAAFVPGDPQDSFILFGDGGRATLDQVENWNLFGVDLVVLSACQTAVGTELGNGEEILGLGYQMQQAGALATVATLWIVDDEGTQLLMDAFYQAMIQKQPKAEALRQAQLALIRSKHEHPYYWAPFILIGNGL